MRPMKLYSWGRKCYQLKIPFLPQLCKGLIFIFYKAVVPFQAEIGMSTRLGHGGVGVVIHPDAVIGKNVLIGNSVTIGGKKDGDAAPTIGNNVFISSGAKVLGKITIGDNCVVGANAVVINNVQPNCIVAGVPAKVIRENIKSFDVISW